MKNWPRKAPASLSAEARAIWCRLVSEYEISDPAGLHLATIAMEALDRMREAQMLIKERGICTQDRFGQLRSNPATIVERDARSAMLAALRALHLDLEPIRDRAARLPGR